MNLAKASDTLEILRQNLCDAGCDEAVIQMSMAYAKSGAWDRIVKLLHLQKSALLGQVRTGQKQIDCLDYLVYHLNKNQEELQ